MFKTFRAVQPQLQGRAWRYNGAGGARPDIIVSGPAIGIELAELLHQAQTQQARERERFEGEVRQAARRRGLRSYLRSFSPPKTRFAVGLDVRAVPPARTRQQVIRDVLDFIRRTRKPTTTRELLHGITITRSALPTSLNPFFDGIRISIPRGRFNPGLEVSVGGAYDPHDADTALAAVLRTKIQNPNYGPTKVTASLREMWLVVYYDRGVLWNTPYRGVRIGMGGHSTDEAAVAANARQVLRRSGSGAFDRIFLFFPHRPSPIQLWP
jgi:hypothetical protein